jgi:hypothetical protein
MEIKSEIMLRVNGAAVSEVSLRHPCIDGHIHPDKYEVEIIDPALGRFALTDECVIEVRKKENGCAIRPRTWNKVSLTELTALLSPR